MIALKRSGWKLILYIFFSDDEFGEKTVSILLDGEESEMVFIDHPSTEMSVSVPCWTKDLLNCSSFYI